MKPSESVAEVLELVSELNFSFQRGTPKYWLHTGMGEKVEESQNTGFNKEPQPNILLYRTPQISQMLHLLYFYTFSLCVYEGGK